MKQAVHRRITPHGLSRNGGIRENPIPPHSADHHLFTLFGILDENGLPVEDMGIVAHDAGDALPLRNRAAGVIDIPPGKRCPECGNHTVICKNGCDFCSTCGAVGGCG